MQAGKLGVNPAERDVTMTDLINQMNAEFSAPQIRKQDSCVHGERLCAAVYFELENVIIWLPLYYQSVMLTAGNCSILFFGGGLGMVASSSL